MPRHLRSIAMALRSSSSHSNDRGQSLVEYAIVVAAVSIVLASGVLAMMLAFESAVIAKGLEGVGELL